jgi:hypothetical protein
VKRCKLLGSASHCLAPILLALENVQHIMVWR